MSELQKVIKYCAMGFAVFLTVTIITGIATGILALTGALSANASVELLDFNESFNDVKSISAEHGVGNFFIKVGTGDEVVVVAENVSDNFVAEKTFSGELRVQSKFNFWDFLSGKNGFNSKSQITIYLPKDFVGEKVKIDGGTGNIDIEYLSADKIDIDAGAGDIYGKNIIANKADLGGGIGQITLEQVQLQNVDIDAGVGDIYVEGILHGINKINAGVGNVTLELTGTVDDYNLKVDKGLGSIYINDEKYSEINWGNVTADNTLDIDGGVGNIDIRFK